MRIRGYVPLPGPFVVTSGGRRRKPTSPLTWAFIVIGLLLLGACVGVL
jgi:hypothetical protein